MKQGMTVTVTTSNPGAARSPGARTAGVAIPRPIAPLRQAWPLSVVQPPDVDWDAPLRDWVSWATAPDFITVGPGAPLSAREPVLPQWALPLQSARRLRELAIDGSLGAWTVGRLRRVHTQLAPTASSSLRDRTAWFGGGDDGPLALAPTPDLVPALLEDWCEFVNWQAPDPIAQAAVAFTQLLAIHPFTDGNLRLARVAAGAIVARSAYAPEALLPVFAMLHRHRRESADAVARLEDGIATTVETWRDGLRRGVAFAGVLRAAIDQWERRLATRVGSESRARRLVEIASARPVLDAHLVRAAAGAGNEQLALHWQALCEEGWSPIGADPAAAPWLAGTRFWQRTAALWAMAADAAASGAPAR
jgi:hypothetical protein